MTCSANSDVDRACVVLTSTMASTIVSSDVSVANISSTLAGSTATMPVVFMSSRIGAVYGFCIAPRYTKHAGADEMFFAWPAGRCTNGGADLSRTGAATSPLSPGVTSVTSTAVSERAACLRSRRLPQHSRHLALHTMAA